MSEYLVRRGSALIEAWSTRRLPFEPDGWQAAFRRDLQSSVRELHVSSGLLLYGVYGSKDRTPCDVENVLFYNVGSSAFAAAMCHGVRFERSFESGAARDLHAAHYHRYEPADLAEGFRFWRRRETVRTWTIDELPLDSSKTTSWWDIFTKCDAAPSGVSLPNSFGVEVHLRRRVDRPLAIHQILKPMLDGLVSACHVYDGDQLQPVSERIASVLQIERADVAHRLADASGAVLGARRLVWPWRHTVQWNPADERCVAGAVLVSDGSDRCTPSLTADIFDLAPRHPAPSF